MGKSQFDYDPDFDDYEIVQDQWLDEGDDVKFSREGVSNANHDEIFEVVELDRGINPYGYQIVTPYVIQPESDGSDTDRFYIGDERYSDIEHFNFIAEEMFRDFEDGLVVAVLDDCFTPDGLLEYWQSTWFRLTEAKQKSFLARDEVEMICKWPKVDIKRIMKNEKKLLIVLDLLRKEKQIEAENLKTERARKAERERNSLKALHETNSKVASEVLYRCRNCENLYSKNEPHYCDSFA